MSDTLDLTKKRQHKRFKGKKGLFGVLTSGNNKRGQINEISKSGLTFQYIDNGEPLNDPIEVEIFSTVHDFHLRKLPIKSVTGIEADNTVPLISVPMRKLNIQFGRMTHIQSKLLDYLLKKYTIK